MRNVYLAQRPEVYIASLNPKPFLLKGSVFGQSHFWPVNPKYTGRPIV